MTSEAVVELIQNALWTAVMLGGPFMAAAMVVGLVVSVLQAATQVNEMTLTFVPKALAVGAVLWVGAHWLLQQWMGFATATFEAVGSVGVLP
jgi:flagellar biosynthetic protein FliQ